MNINQHEKDLMSDGFIENLYRLNPGESMSYSLQTYIRVPGGWICESLHSESKEPTTSCFIPWIELPE